MSRSPRTSPEPKDYFGGADGLSGTQQDNRGQTPGRTALGLPLWVWVLIGLGLLALLFWVKDLENRDRYWLICSRATAQVHRGRGLPWPFGHEAVGGAGLAPVSLPQEDTACRDQPFSSQEEAARAFLDLILEQVRSALAKPDQVDLEAARKQIQQAMTLSQNYYHRHRETRDLLADISYLQGKNGLARTENELRLALSRLQEAQKLGHGRFEDLEEWVTHLEDVLKALAPSPGPLAPFPAAIPAAIPASGGSSSATRPFSDPHAGPGGAGPGASGTNGAASEGGSFGTEQSPPSTAPSDDGGGPAPSSSGQSGESPRSPNSAPAVPENSGTLM